MGERLPTAKGSKTTIYLPKSKKERFDQIMQRQKKSRVSSGRSLSKEEIAKYQPRKEKDLHHHARKHKVKKGQTLGQIARLHGIAEGSLRQWNSLSPSDRPEEGTILSLNKPRVFKWVSHVVEKKQTLEGIAKKFNCTVEDIRKWNAMSEGAKVQDGRQLWLKKQD